MLDRNREQKFLELDFTAEVFRNEWFSITENRYRFGDRIKSYYFMEKSDFSCVVPIDKFGKFVLIDIHRIPIDQSRIEFPQGSDSEGKNFKLMAINELREEAGIVANSWEYLGYIHEAYGYSTARCHIFLAKDLSFGVPDRDDFEQSIQIIRADRDELDLLIDTSQITDAVSIAAYHLASRSVFND